MIGRAETAEAKLAEVDKARSAARSKLTELLNQYGQGYWDGAQAVLARIERALDGGSDE